MGSCSGLHQCIPHIPGSHYLSSTLQLLDCILWIHERARAHEHRGQKAWKLKHLPPKPLLGIRGCCKWLVSSPHHLGGFPLGFTIVLPHRSWLHSAPSFTPAPQTNDLFSTFCLWIHFWENVDIVCGLHQAAEEVRAPMGQGSHANGPHPS